MIEINIGALVVLLGIPTAVTGFCFWMLEHRIQKREKQKEAEEAKRQKEAAARERAREDLQIITIQGNDLAVRHVQRHTAQGLNAAIGNM